MARLTRDRAWTAGAQRREDLRRAELEPAALTERYFVSAADRTADDLVEVVTGIELITKRFQQLQAGAREEVRALVTAHTVAVPREDNPAEDDGVLGESSVASSSSASWSGSRSGC